MIFHVRDKEFMIGEDIMDRFRGTVPLEKLDAWITVECLFAAAR